MPRDPAEEPPEGHRARSRIAAAVRAASHLLPAQGPIGVFIHHNTLHAFEAEPFESAVVTAGRRYGCEPFWPHERYLEQLKLGRIREADVSQIISSELGGPQGAEQSAIFAGSVTRGELWQRLACAAPAEHAGPELGWVLAETDALERYRAESRLAPAEHAWQVRELWDVCLERVRELPQPPPEEGSSSCPLGARSHLDECVNPLLVRFLGAYFDQGLAYWPMAAREAGLLECFRKVYLAPGLPEVAPWFGRARELLRESAQGGGAECDPADALELLQQSLEALGVPEQHFEEYLTQAALSLGGWAGLIHQVELRPERLPHVAVPAKLADFLALKLLLDRAVAEARAATGGSGTLERATGGAATGGAATGGAVNVPAASKADAELARAFRLFNACQLCGVETAVLRGLSVDALSEFDAELASFDDVARRRVLHLAYELHLRQRAYSALLQRTAPSPSAAAHPAAAPPAAAHPAAQYQVLLCLDEREESLRRHLEEVSPGVETYGVAGFFGVAMNFRAQGAARHRALCPAAIMPAHSVAEARPETAPGEAVKGSAVKVASSVRENQHWGGNTLVRGALVSVLLGLLSLVPLVLRVLFPGMLARGAAGRAQGFKTVEQVGAPELLLEGSYTPAEMADVVYEVLRTAGLATPSRTPSRLVLVLGHVARSVNNPHQSAYGCGACGGAGGGPNARVFAQMAQNPRVRELLAERGLVIPEDTWFVGGEHDTTRDTIAFFDTEALPPEAAQEFEIAVKALEQALMRNAQERTRRFDVGVLSPERAARHAAFRSQDLAQPRPEYNHATNALCVVGRRERTRGLFLDRRAFLVSYDPRGDEDASLLRELLLGVVPVVAGINLEYFFGSIDNQGYGAGTKLPHNITGLVGVMNGALSDLRTGLWAQTVEIHEPVRLTLVVECERHTLLRLVDAEPRLRQLVYNRWLVLAALAPEAARIWELCTVRASRARNAAPGASGANAVHWEEAHVTEPLVSVGPNSAAWFLGKSGHLAFAEISPARDSARGESATLRPPAVSTPSAPQGAERA